MAASIPLYQVAFGTLARILTTTHDILSKAKETHPNLIPSLPRIRLYEDMNPLYYQVQTVCNFAHTLASRLTTPTATSFAPLHGWEKYDEETITVDQLLEKIAIAREVLAKVTPEKVAEAVVAAAKDAEEKKTKTYAISNPEPRPSFAFDASQFVLGYVLPNSYFHMNILYAILRKEGVPLGKADYLTPFLKEAVVGTWGTSH
ncbi:hypothetical protein QBC35DRAFT_67920 [Podospora australis]|uniref:DUF1993 domain-containing protein n=1 Tax=Podospora australis TaxID=1536484 RepID=A0AAN6WLL0_9PEZI|nr:hypothetical protein QBC35DRAFT_67920 [Podospora australis]